MQAVVPFDQLLAQAQQTQETQGKPDQIPSGSNTQAKPSDHMVPLETPGPLPPDTIMADEEAHAYDNVSGSENSEEESPEKPAQGRKRKGKHFVILMKYQISISFSCKVARVASGPAARSSRARQTPEDPQYPQQMTQHRPWTTQWCLRRGKMLRTPARSQKT